MHPLLRRDSFLSQNLTPQLVNAIKALKEINQALQSKRGEAERVRQGINNEEHGKAETSVGFSIKSLLGTQEPQVH